MLLVLAWLLWIYHRAYKKEDEEILADEITNDENKLDEEQTLTGRII